MARLFVAVDMPPKVCDKIGRIQEQLQQRNLFQGRYTDSTSAHATLAFIGNVSVDSSANIKKMLTGVRGEIMRAKLETLDVFCSGGHVRIVYLSFVCEELASLVLQIEEALTSWNVKKERDFVTHVTVARVKKVYDSNVFRATLGEITFEKIDFLIQSFTLKQSILLPDGPQYKTLETYWLH